MENKFYSQLKNTKETIEAQIKSEAENLFGVEIIVNVGIKVHGIPISMMPEGSMEIKGTEAQWLHYAESLFLPDLYSKPRKFKIVFEDEPASHEQN
jgi:hypothetical protein